MVRQQEVRPGPLLTITPPKRGVLFSRHAASSCRFSVGVISCRTVSMFYMKLVRSCRLLNCFGACPGLVRPSCLCVLLCLLVMGVAQRRNGVCFGGASLSKHGQISKVSNRAKTAYCPAKKNGRGNLCCCALSLQHARPRHNPAFCSPRASTRYGGAYR